MIDPGSINWDGVRSATFGLVPFDNLRKAIEKTLQVGRSRFIRAEDGVNATVQIGPAGIKLRSREKDDQLSRRLSIATLRANEALGFKFPKTPDDPKKAGVTSCPECHCAMRSVGISGSRSNDRRTERVCQNPNCGYVEMEIVSGGRRLRKAW